MNTSHLRRITLFLAALTPSLSAEVIRVEIKDRRPVLDGKIFGTSGNYEHLRGLVYFEIDPDLPINRIISDVALTPRNSNGKVSFSANFDLIKPVSEVKGNGTLLFEVSNRGGKGLMGMFNFAENSLLPNLDRHFGDGFLLRQGFTLAWLGWQFDVPEDPLLMRLQAPTARNGTEPISGLIRSEFIPDRRVFSFSLGDRTMRPYAVADPGDPKLELTVRDSRNGVRRTIPRDQWHFIHQESQRRAEALGAISLPQGFEPGKIYEIVYRAQDPVLVGLGPAAVRDFVTFLKQGPSEPTALKSELGRSSRAIGFGISQSGRFLRTFLYYGFNQDESGRQVFDGVFAHVAGAGRGSFNHRFAQASRDGHPFMNCFYPTDIFPFSDLPQTDPETDITEGLLDRATKAGVVPKVFYTNSSYEYFGRAASLIHTTIDGKSDLPLAPNTRIYLLAGGQHGPAPFPPGRQGIQQLANPNDFRWSMRSLLLRFDRWLKLAQPPPDSRYPRIGERQLVPLSSLNFPRISGVNLPLHIQTAFRLNFGPMFRSQGIVSIEPPEVGKPFPVLVPQVGPDGNELAGIRLPTIDQPLASYTGWNLRSMNIGASDELFSRRYR